MPFQGSNTFIEFCVDGFDDEKEHQRKEAELSIVKTAMERLGATLVQGKVVEYSKNPYWNSYETAQPPYLVLNRLESQAGYKVVAANSVTHHTGFHYQIWTLHKQA